MKKVKHISAEEFYDLVKKDHYFLSKITNPLEVHGYTDCRDIPIKALSPLVKFTDGRESGGVANFKGCHLEVAEGVFDGFVNFRESRIKKIGRLQINYPNKDGNAADFGDCGNLEIATGVYPGGVDFSFTSVKEIKDLQVTNANADGIAASFDGCNNLMVLTGSFHGAVSAQFTFIKKLKGISITKTDNMNYALFLNDSPLLKTIEGHYPGAIILTSSGDTKDIGNLIIDSPSKDDGKKLYMGVKPKSAEMTEEKEDIWEKEQAEKIYDWMKRSGTKLSEVAIREGIEKKIKRLVLRDRAKTTIKGEINL